MVRYSRKVIKDINKLCWRQRSGFSLLDVLVAMAIMGIVAVVFLNALATSHRATITADERVTAESLARKQLESMKGVAYINYGVSGHPEYALADAPLSYSISLLATPVDSATLQPLPNGQDQGIQVLAVTVARNGDDLFTVHGLKVNR